MVNVQRKLAVGAELVPEGGVHFRVWAPRCTKVEVVLEGGGHAGKREAVAFDLSAERGGYFSEVVKAARAGMRYRYRLDGGAAFPDPASRYQPEGPHGPSEVVDPAFNWTDGGWRGLTKEGHVIYEMHIGTFTKEGTWRSAMEELKELVQLGITVVEVMPVAEFPGSFGWGYDGVDLFAPTRLYGTPEDFRSFIDHAHCLGLGVILDVVYNHLGPEGNYLTQYSSNYFTTRYQTEWGDPINFDGEDSAPVREFFLANARYWISEFHVDGLRLDATQTIFDSSSPHILSCISQCVRKAAGERGVLLVAENEPQHTRLVRPPEQDGYGLDALWNDDFHHSARVAVTGYNDAYYSEYLGAPQELISAAKWGYLFQGQRYFWQGKRRGSSTLDLSPSCFINFIENHDQVANSAWGWRIHQLTSPGCYRSITAYLLLLPGTPMLFQGQEFAASTPFLYFADLNPELARAVRKGRVEFLKQFTNITAPEMIEMLDNPGARATFERSRLDLSERQLNAGIYALHRDLIRLRKEDEVFSQSHAGSVEGAVLGPEAFLLRFFAAGGERLLLVNLGRDLRLAPAPEPLLAPPEDMRWKLLWSSERPGYGGSGTPELEREDCWRIQGHAAVVLAPVPVAEVEMS